MWWDFLTMLFDTEWFFGLLEKSPVQLVVYTLVIFALGAAAGVWNGKRVRADLEYKVSERDHEITRLTTQLEGERTRAASVDGLKRSLEVAGQDSKRLHQRIEELEGELADRESALASARQDAARETEARLNAAQEAKARSWVLELDPDEKMALLKLSRQGSLVTKYVKPGDFRDFMRSLGVGVSSTRIDMDWKGNYAYRLTLNDFGRLAAQVGMDLLEDVERVRAQREEEADA